MEEEKKELTDAQKQIVQNIFTSKVDSTFVLCANDLQNEQIEKFTELVKHIENKPLSPEQKAALDKEREEVQKIHKENTFCVHCGKLANVTFDEKGFTLSCDCEGAKKELEDKKKIEEKAQALGKEFSEIQQNSTNKAFNVYKDHYKDIIDYRNKMLKELDDGILNAENI